MKNGVFTWILNLKTYLRKVRSGLRVWEERSWRTRFAEIVWQQKCKYAVVSITSRC